MKRKRLSGDEEKRDRPFQKREELLNVCLSVVLKYNTEFSYPVGDLTLYRYAENIADMDKLNLFIDKLKQSIREGQELIGI